MRKPEQAPEPSIEEILASIRRIIADDTPVSAEAEREGAAATVQQQGQPVARPRPAGQAPRLSEARREDDVFELTEELTDEYASGGQGRTLGGRRQAVDPGEMSLSELSREAVYRDPFRARETSDDSYEDIAFAVQRGVFTGDTRAEQTGRSSDGLADVMAEVRGYVDGGMVADTPRASDASRRPAETPSRADASAAADTQGAAETPRPTVRPLDNWVQPQNDVFRSDPAPRPPTRWSARHAASDAGRVPEPGKAPDVAQTRPSGFPRDGAALRKPGTVDREGWSENVRMPVSEDAAGMPFAPDEPAELPPAPSPLAAEATLDWSAPPLDIVTADTVALQPAREAPEPISLFGAMDDGADSSQPLVPSEVQARAERLADKAVSDFAADKLNADAPVTAFLKADRPLMEEITGTLADALSRVGDADEPSEKAESAERSRSEEPATETAVHEMSPQAMPHEPALQEPVFQEPVFQQPISQEQALPHPGTEEQEPAPVMAAAAAPAVEATEPASALAPAMETAPEAALPAIAPAEEDAVPPVEQRAESPAVEAPTPVAAAEEKASTPDLPTHAALERAEAESDPESDIPELPALPDLPPLEAAFLPPQPLAAPASTQPRLEAAMSDAMELPRDDADDADLGITPPPPQIDEPPMLVVGRPAVVHQVAPMTVQPRTPAPLRAMALAGARDTGMDRLQPSVTAPKTLEDAVREMLRPMLAQWLNENMPRILNDAIREELAAAGIGGPRLDSDKR